jgi:hypothetical protein
MLGRHCQEGEVVSNNREWIDDIDRLQALWRSISLVERTMLSMMPDRFDRIWGSAVHHYTDLGTAEKLIRHRNLWRTDARYCNDREEMLHAARAIEAGFNEFKRTSVLARITPAVTLLGPDLSFADTLLNRYVSTFPNLVALICCFCEGDNSRWTAQDILSQWRGYGANGKGACASFAASDLLNLAKNTRGMLFQPVLYEEDPQRRVIEEIVSVAVADFRKGNPHAVQSGCDALSMVTPLFKHLGFSEEREWRLVFMSQPESRRLRI